MWWRLVVNQAIHSAAEKKMEEAASEKARRELRALIAAGEAPNNIELPTCDLLVVFALGVESSSFLERLEDRVDTRMPTFHEHLGEIGDRRVAVIETGVGQQRAGRALKDCLEIYQPAWVVSAGFAGGLTTDVIRGHILMADVVLNEQGERWEMGLEMDDEVVNATPSLHVGTLLTVNKLLRLPAEKIAKGEQHAALACDMETAAIASVCSEAKTRFLSVRIISDGVEDEIPTEIESLMEQSTVAGKIGAAAGAIFRRPGSIKDMIRLQEDASKASGRLARFLDGVLPQLGE